MKKLSLLIAIAISCFQFAFSQNFYYGPRGKVTLEIYKKQILVKFAPGVDFAQQKTILSKEKLIVPLTKEQILPSPKVTLVDLQGVENDLDLSKILTRLNSLEQVIYARHFLAHEDGTLHGVMDELIVKISAEKDKAAMEYLVENFGAKVTQQSEFADLQFQVKTNKASGRNALELANSLYETGLFDFAEPNFLRIMKPMNTNDPLLENQWSLKNDGNNTSDYNGIAGSDMKVIDAWATTTGSSAIKVAILDEGVDLNHPDLIPNLLPGFDATEQGSDGAPSGNDAHGTACAGIVAGAANNNIGIAGVAYSSRIIPIRIAYKNSAGNWVTSNEWIGNAINWAWQTANADILSNSWGGGSPSSIIEEAIDGAINSGRGGLGAPVLFAAGNSNNGAAGYPSSYEPVISVVAMRMCDERK